VLSIIGIILEEIKFGLIPINPTIIRAMRVLRIARGRLHPLSLATFYLHCSEFLNVIFCRRRRRHEIVYIV